MNLLDRYFRHIAVNINHTQDSAKAGRKEEIPMKKLIALALAGVMVFSLPVMAASSPSAAVVAQSATAKVEAAASAENMTVSEYTNNAVVEVPGLDDVVPAGQGGHVIINGAPSNVTFQLVKPTATVVKSAKAEATALGGKVLNVFGTKSTVGKFSTARVNFYLKGVKAGQNIKVFQLVKGEWVEVTVSEIRADHVVVDLTAHGTLAFIEVPAVPAE